MIKITNEDNMDRKEIWKDIPGYEGCYQASNLGNIRSLYFNKLKLLSQKIRKDGYYEVNLYLNGAAKSFKVHQLVCMAFKGHIRCGFKKVVDHIDNDKSNNKVENLQIISNRLNTSKDTYINKMYNTSLGVSLHKKTGKYMSRIRIKGRLIHLGVFDNNEDAHNAYLNALNKL